MLFVSQFHPVISTVIASIEEHNFLCQGLTVPQDIETIICNSDQNNNQAAGKTKEKKILDVKKPETFQEMASIDSMVVSGLFIAGGSCYLAYGTTAETKKRLFAGCFELATLFGNQ